MLKLTKNTLLASTFASVLVACGGHSGPSENAQYPNLTHEEAIDLITVNGRITNNDHAVISTDLEDWQVKNLAIYALLAYDISQQANNLATDNYDINIHDHVALFGNILANDETGLNSSHFQGATYLDDVCKPVEGNPYNQFTVEEHQFSDTMVTTTTRDVKIQGKLELDECHVDYSENNSTRKHILHGTMNYAFDFINEVNSNGSQTPSSFQSKMHGKWLVSGDTLGYKDNFGYWFLENISVLSNYNKSSSSTDVITSELRTDLYIRDAYNNWDHRYFVHLTEGVIKTKLGSKNPYSGKLVMTNDGDTNLTIEFSDSAVDIYINGDRVYNDLSWTDLRASSLDI